MANPNPKTDHLEATRWHAGESGNPAGKPRGTKHLSTWIRELMEDEGFEQKLKDGTVLRGAPVQAVVKVLITKAIQGDMRAFDLLAKYGYGTKIDVTSDGERLYDPTSEGTLGPIPADELNKMFAELMMKYTAV